MEKLDVIYNPLKLLLMDQIIYYRLKKCLHGVPPDYNMLEVFGCACFVHLLSHEYTKLESRARLRGFLGYGIA